MPGIVTHTLFSEEVLNCLDNPMLNAHRAFFITGGQGPDFLFYDHASAKRIFTPAPLRKYGTLLHHENINAFYQSALKSIRQEKNPAIQDDLIAYICGHLCHWALDSTLHPFIYSRTGNCKGKSSWRHHRYESLLDAALLKYYKNLTITDFDPSKECFSTDLHVARAIARIYGPALEDLYGEEIRPSDFVKILQEWKAMQERFYDPLNRKKAVLEPIEKITHLNNLFTGFSIPNEVEDNIDVCNLLHTPWPDPVTGELHEESILDLWQIALPRALRAIGLFLKAVRKKDQEQAFLDFLGNCDYDTGMPDSPKQIYFRLVDLTN